MPTNEHQNAALHDVEPRLVLLRHITTLSGHGSAFMRQAARDGTLRGRCVSLAFSGTTS